MNQQKVEDQIIRSDGMLDVVDIFWTIQGEGIFVGCPAVFVRFAGCNLRCPACDTDYTTKRSFEKNTAIFERILNRVPSNIWKNALMDRVQRLVVFTGGEPFRQDFGNLASYLLNDGWDVQVETNGTLYQEYFPYADSNIVCSPKTNILHPKMVDNIHYLKYIINAVAVDPRDGLPIESLGYHCQPARIPDFPPSRIFVQPEANEDPDIADLNIKAAVQSCLQFGYRLSLQTHKLIGVP